MFKKAANRLRLTVVHASERWLRLVEPVERIRDPEQRRKSRLLASLLPLIAATVFSIYALRAAFHLNTPVETINILAICLLLLVGSYGSRYGLFKPVTLLCALLGSVFIFGSIFIPAGTITLANLDYLMAVIVFCSV